MAEELGLGMVAPYSNDYLAGEGIKSSLTRRDVAESQKWIPSGGLTQNDVGTACDRRKGFMLETTKESIH